MSQERRPHLADWVVRAGVIHAMTPQTEVHRSIAMRDERIVAIARGAHDLDDLIDETTRVVDDPDLTLLRVSMAMASDGDKCAISGVLMSAGHETSTNLICNGLLALLRNPDQMTLLRENPELIGTAVEEFLRYDSRVQWNARLALEDVEVGGVGVRRGDLVSIGHSAANRDPKQFSGPDAEHQAEPQSPPGLRSRDPFLRWRGPGAARRSDGHSDGAAQNAGLRWTATDVTWNPGFVLRSVKSLPVVF